MWDTDASTGTVVDNWVVYGNNTVAVDSDTVLITYVDTVSGAKVPLTNAADLSSDLTVGRKYKFTCDAKVGSGDSVYIYM